ncbi:MAG: YggT family protein [Anaerolineales bacterium]
MDTDVLRIQLSRLIWWIFGVIEALLGFRILLKLLAANPEAAFVRWIYQASGWLLQPFEGVAAVPNMGPGTLDLPSIIGLLVYIVASWLIIQLLAVLFPPTHPQEPGAA